MRENTIKTGTVRVPVPVTTWRGWQRGAPWIAEADTPAQRFRGEGKTEAEAKGALTQLILTAMARAEQRPVVVIGGAAPDYDRCVHVVVPEPYGYTTYAIRDGRVSGTTIGSDETLSDAVDAAVRHVGGSPQVVRL